MAPYNMCGIAGNINKRNGAILASRMASIIKHRGPDEGPAVVSNDLINMAAVRLSIVDVNNGTQPMVDNNGNVLSQNGEIYNHDDLREDLKSKGFEFKSSCDTEVLLKGFSFYGPNFVEKLDGIFAISYFDSKNKALYLFRDHFGVKPLYYSRKGNSLEYASEIKAFWYDNQSYRINTDYLIYNQVFNWSDPKLTLYEGITPVPPSSYLKISKEGKIRIYSYKPSGFSKKADNYAEAQNLTRSELERAVASQIPKEVKWGVLLSGGVDSSILASLAKTLHKNIHTFSVASTETETEDLLNARKIAQKLNSTHEEIRVKSKDAIKNYADYLYSIEDINSRFFFYYFISRHLQKRGIKVALCGEGSDELYMGYPVYRESEQFLKDIKLRWKKLKSKSKNISTRIESIIKSLESNRENNLYRIMIKNQLPWFQLNPVDKCSMRFGIELRVPYLSLVHSIPVMKYPKKYIREGKMEKMILRESFASTKLPTIFRKKFFAGTRTLPTFYKKLDDLAKKEYPQLLLQFPKESKILDFKDLYSLSLLDKKMRLN